MSVKTVQAIVNGQTYNLILNSQTGYYEATITAPATSSYPLPGHYYPITVRAEDTAGNAVTKDASDTLLGNSLRLLVKEKTAPVLTVTSPTESALISNNKPAITWTAQDEDSGVNPDSIRLILDTTAITSGITKTASGRGYNCSYTPGAALADGGHTIQVTASDCDGNAASPKNLSFRIDTIPPVLNVTVPVNNYVTNQVSCNIAGSTSDITSSPCTVTVKLNSSTATPVTVNADGTFSKELLLTEGSNTIVVTSRDQAGKTTTVTRTVMLDTSAPIIKEIIITPNPVDAGKTFTLRVKVED